MIRSSIMTVMLASACTWGCTLVVGTEERAVADVADSGDSGAGDSGPTPVKDSAAAPEADVVDASTCSTKACLDKENQCRAACATALTDCQKPCHGGPMGDACRMDCTSASQACDDKCASACSSCASASSCMAPCS